jgi:catechol 2,3-dioxygenase-like lactoylglutathione lyase family enzyme
VHFRRVRLQAPAHALEALSEFYCDRLDLPELRVGETELEFGPGEGDPFYHFALLVPGDRFEAAHGWISSLVGLLPSRQTGDTVFDFDFWDAKACYFDDPAGNIVELIAHRGIEESFEAGDFHAAELRGISEVGLVADDLLAALDRLRAGGLELWYGEVGREEGLGFVGRKGHTLILVPTGRPWLPTGRPAASYPVEVVLARPGRPELVARLRGGSVEVAVPKDG